jgi:hypothetical protein
MKNLLAFDLGASNGRAILGRFDGEKLEMRELHRFENNYVEMNGVCYWDLPYLYNQLKLGLLAFKNAGVGELDCFGIDTWGVDYGLLDENGQLLGNPRAYRMGVDADMQAVWKTVDFPTLFARTGIASLNFNTVYQLYRRRRENDAALREARTMLMLPDLLGYFLTGEKKSEYTNATTSMLYNPTKKDWDRETIRALGLPEGMFTPLDRAGQLRGRLRPELARELGLNEAAFAAVGTHDTASAVAAIPGSGSFAFCSSGTWSLFGVETDEPILTPAVRDANFSNEGTIQGGFRPLKNIMGLWLIQECRRDWIRAGTKVFLGRDRARGREGRAARLHHRPRQRRILQGRRDGRKDPGLLPQDRPEGARERRRSLPLHLRVACVKISVGARAAGADQGPAHRHAQHRGRRHPEQAAQPDGGRFDQPPRRDRPRRGRGHRQPARPGHGAGRTAERGRAARGRPPLRAGGDLRAAPYPRVGRGLRKAPVLSEINLRVPHRRRL